MVICEPSRALAGTLTAVIAGFTLFTVRPKEVVAVSPAAVAVIVTSVGAAVLSGGVYDQLHVPAVSFFVTVPRDAVSVTVLLPCGSETAPVVVMGEPSLPVAAGTSLETSGAVLGMKLLLSWMPMLLPH